MFKTKNERDFLFWIICIPVRLSIVILLTILTTYQNTIITLLAASYCWFTSFCFAINIIRQYLGFKTKGGFGGDCWWKYLRPIHVITYTVTGFLIFYTIDYGPFVLLIDIFIGAFIGKYCLSNNP